MSGILLARLYDAGYSRHDAYDILMDLTWFIFLAALFIAATGYTVDFVSWVIAVSSGLAKR